MQEAMNLHAQSSSNMKALSLQVRATQAENLNYTSKSPILTTLLGAKRAGNLQAMRIKMTTTQCAVRTCAGLDWFQHVG